MAGGAQRAGCNAMRSCMEQRAAPLGGPWEQQEGSPRTWLTQWGSHTRKGRLTLLKAQAHSSNAVAVVPAQPTWFIQ